MPVSPEKKAKFLKRVDRYLDLNQRVTDQETRRVIKVLKDARNRVVQDFQTLSPTEFRAFYLPNLKARLEERMVDLGANITSELNKSQARMWELALDKADELTSAAGLGVSPSLVSPELLSATQSLTGELIVTVPENLLAKLGNDVALGLMQEKGIGEVVADMQKDFDLAFFQAERIARTENLRTQSLAQHKRFEQVAELQPDVMKAWRWSHKPDGRTGHAEAEINYLTKSIPFNDPFLVASAAGGRKEPLQFPRDPAGSAGNVINCYDKKTEVLTSKGFKLFENLKKNDDIATMNPETKEIEYHKAVRFIKYKHKGKMIHYKHRSMDLMVTKDHNMPCIKSWDYTHKRQRNITMKYAHELSKGDILLRGAEWKGKKIKRVKINNKKYDTELFMKFMGWYLSEGCVSDISYKKQSMQYQISIKQFNNNKFDEIKILCKKMFKRLWIGKNNIHIIDDNLGEYLFKLGKSYEKYIPQELKDLDKYYLLLFLDTYCKGDGHIIKKEKMTNHKWGGKFKKDKRMFFTSSPQLAEDIGELILKTGKVPRFAFPKKSDYNKKIKFKNGIYKIKHPCIRIYEINLLTYSHLKKYEKLINYNDFVYCVTMPVNHIIYVRRNGYSIWSGNCGCVHMLRRPEAERLTTSIMIGPLGDILKIAA